MIYVKGARIYKAEPESKCFGKGSGIICVCGVGETYKVLLDYQKIGSKLLLKKYEFAAVIAVFKNVNRGVESVLEKMAADASDNKAPPDSLEGFTVKKVTTEQ